MTRVHVIGRRNHGKTTLIADLVTEMVRRGLRVGTLKHSSHVHELDVPGKDSFRHRQAGATPAGVITAELAAIYIPRQADDEPYERLAPLYAATDLVLVEGHATGPGPSVEVWRATMGEPPLANERDDIAAVVSDDAPQVSVPVWSRTDLRTLATRVLALGAES